MDFRESIIALLEKEGVPRALAPLEVPPDSKLGDYALPCFLLSKERKKAPVQIAQELAGQLRADFLREVRATGPYVNFFVRQEQFATHVLAAIAAQGESYGKGEPKNDKVMVEYSQPNTHKAFHVGHLRGTSLGESLSRILRLDGYEVVQANYSGDTGMHVAKWLWYYTTHDKGEPPKDKKDLERWIAGIYVKSIKELEAHPEAQEDVNKILISIDRREEGELFDIYKKTREWSIEAFNQIYKDLHAHFDEWYFESQAEERGKELSRELVRKGVAMVDKGATVIDFTERKMGMLVLLRADGTPLYSAKELALGEMKYHMHKIGISIYVVGAAQSLYLQQLFAAIDFLEFPQKNQHLSFAEVRLPTGKMSSRTGQNILYSDIRDEVAAYAREEVRKRHDDWSSARVEDVVCKVTVAALKWDMLAIHPNKNIVFDSQEATQFEGETGPYLQYTHARACSILEKAKGERSGDGASLAHEKELALLKLLADFPEIIAKAAREYQPSVVAHYAMALGKAFNSFYHDCPVLSAQDETQRADRIALVRASASVLARALGLLAIDAPEEM